MEQNENDQLDDSLVFVDLDDAEEQADEEQQDVKPVILTKIAPVPNVIMVKVEDADDEEVKPIIRSGIAKAPKPIMVKAEGGPDIAGGSANNHSTDVSLDEASTSFSLSDLDSPEDRTEDLRRLYGCPSPNTEQQHMLDINAAVKRLSF